GVIGYICIGVDMVPYRGRLALRIARTLLALTCLALYARNTDGRLNSVIAVLAAYVVYSVGALFEARFDSNVRAAIALVADTAFFGFWIYMGGSAGGGWLAPLLCGYVLASAAMIHD